MFRLLLFVCLVLIVLVVPSRLEALEAVTTGILDLQMGPASTFKTIEILPRGQGLSVSGCLRGWSWCKVSLQGREGWLPGRYLQDEREEFNQKALPFYGEKLGIPLIKFSVRRRIDSGGRRRSSSENERERLEQRIEKGRVETLQCLKRFQDEMVRERRQLQDRQRSETLKRREDDRARRKAREDYRRQLEEELLRQR